MKRIVSTTSVYSCAIVLQAGLAGVTLPAYGEASTPLLSTKDLAGRLGCRVEFFDVNGCPAFVYLPAGSANPLVIPWVWYAPTRPNTPDPSHVWMFRRFLDRGIAIAGVEVGESYGSPQGRAIYTALWEKLRRDYKLSERACLMPQSRGGLMLYNWAAENPARVACIAGIYTVCDPRSYPGLATACKAYNMSEATLAAHLAEHNPLDRLRPLVEAGVPILHVHGDNDKVVPLEKNSGELARRYRALAGSMRLIVVPGKGHEVVTEFFECQELVDFVIAHATAEVKSATTKSIASAIPLIRNGHSDYRIVTPAKASPAVTYAAGELQSFLEQIGGVRLPIVSEKDAGDALSILLGPCEKTQKAGLPAAAAKLGEDGVLIRTLGRDLALLGQNERGNLYGVYVLLEKYLGVRFLAWDCTVVPKQSEVALPELDYSYAPPFMYRETLYFNSFSKEIATRQRLNGPMSKCDESVGGKIEFYPYVHSFDDLFPEKEYFKDHPEYYGLQGGKRVAGSVHAQLCLTNPDVLRLAKEKVLQWIDEHPNVPIIDVSQNDGNGACECEKCAAIVKEEGSQQGTILRFVNTIADEVAKKHPDKWIETLAYAYSMNPPSITRPRNNVIIRLCHAGCFLHGFEQCKQGAELAAYVDQWSKLTRRIFVWHYGTNFDHYFALNPNLNGLVKDIRFYASHGVNGVMVQCDYQGPGGELAELRQYLCAQLLWDPARDPLQIREEFCRGYYGKAAPDVLEFLGRMDKASEEPVHIFAVWDPQVTVTPEFMDEAMKTLQKALSSAETPAEKNRIEKLMLPFWYVKFMYPDKYGLSNADAAVLLEQVKRVVAANGITHVCEGEPNIQPWLVSLEARYPTSRPKR